MRIGFSLEPEETKTVPQIPAPEPAEPVRSLVRVSFDGDGRVLTYYNDLFNLTPGDRVFVSGKLAGRPGTVESVTTKFKINLANYERVISMADMNIHGTYERIFDKMVSYDPSALSPDLFRAWCRPPKAEDEEIVTGDGYEFNLSELSSPDEISGAIMDRGLEYCRAGNVAYISFIDGIGTAFVHGTEWYELNFQLEGDRLVEMYCDCPYPGFCKHLAALSITMKAMTESGELDMRKNFVAIDDSFFWTFAAKSVKKVTL